MKKILLIIALVALLIMAWQWRGDINQQQIELWIEQAGLWAPIFFIVLYAVATVLFVPGTVLTLAGGALFGPIFGALINLTGATIGATLAFLVSRYVASDWVEQKAAGKMKKILEGVEEEGWRFVAFTRLVPLFPFNLLNYVLGLTKIPFLHYVVASWIFMLPACFAYTYLGYAGGEALKGSESMIQNGVIALALIALVAFIPRVVTRMRQDSGDGK
ncbi:MAG: TVP38/TMEM64 family protein [Gammaproteobacteria bacterium]|uniref:TVP38/TMEM64 family membrane protein n=1 Tax=Candidatus Thiopontia autotrophica TaxID=2841688 RepID=A0A8J6P8G1_9GAMM|nr:TVP38/TMEM64 family protein [Candidatus Thiopontia autotrophica]MBL6969474.1 TVP38/TMEM64 family protein [Gammaproteobacteria bacterium]